MCVSFSSLVAWHSVPHWRLTRLHSEAAGFRVRLLEAWLCHFLAVGYWQLFNHASASSFMTECWWQPSWQLLWELNDLVCKKLPCVPEVPNKVAALLLYPDYIFSYHILRDAEAWGSVVDRWTTSSGRPARNHRTSAPPTPPPQTWLRHLEEPGADMGDPST